MIESSHAKPGFALIEIVVAIMIIAIMATIGFQAFRFIGKAKASRTEATLQSVQLAINMFQSNTGELPAALTELVSRPANATIAKRWKGPYVDKEEELQDAWFKDLQYQRNPKNAPHPYELYSWGPNGEGSPDDEHITVWK